MIFCKWPNFYLDGSFIGTCFFKNFKRFTFLDDAQSGSIPRPKTKDLWITWVVVLLVAWLYQSLPILMFGPFISQYNRRRPRSHYRSCSVKNKGIEPRNIFRVTLLRNKFYGSLSERRYKENNNRIIFLKKNGLTPASFILYFRSLQTNIITIFTTNVCQKCPF